MDRGYAARAGIHPQKVEFPTLKKLSEAVFVDALRQVSRCGGKACIFHGRVWAEVDDPTLGSEYHNDRIDFVYVRGETGVLNVSWMLPLSVEMHPASI